MIIAIVLGRKLQTMIGFLTLVMLCAVVGVQTGFTKGESMKKADFQVSVDGRRVEFTPSPVFKDGTWLVPLKPFAEQLGLKVEYPKGTEMVVLCGGVESELCVPLQFQDSKNGVVHIDGVPYAQPVNVTEPFGFQIYETSPNRLEVIHAMHLAPEFTLPDLEDIPRRLRDFRGKKTFLYVWGSW